jgi:coproporphyrinogen III oxidase-like Fe-S oxidoreductase
LSTSRCTHADGCSHVDDGQQKSRPPEYGRPANDGVDLEQISALSGHDPIDRDAVARLVGQELLEQEGSRLRATAAGRLVLNSLLAEIVAIS